MIKPVLRKEAYYLFGSRVHEDLGRTDMAVLKALVSFSQKGKYDTAQDDVVTDRSVSVALAKIARRAAVDVKTAKVALPRLAKLGLIEITEDEITIRNLGQMEDWKAKQAARVEMNNKRRKKDKERQKKYRDMIHFTQVPIDGKSRARLYTDVLSLSKWQPIVNTAVPQVTATP